MKIFRRATSKTARVRADQVKAGDRIAPGRYQNFGMSNAHRRGETVLEVSTGRAQSDVVYIVSEREPGFAWTLYPDETVVLVVA